MNVCCNYQITVTFRLSAPCITACQATYSWNCMWSTLLFIFYRWDGWGSKNLASISCIQKFNVARYLGDQDLALKISPVSACYVTLSNLLNLSASIWGDQMEITHVKCSASTRHTVSSQKLLAAIVPIIVLLILFILMYTLLCLKCITNKDLLYSAGNSAQCYAAAWMGGEFGGEWIHVYVSVCVCVCVCVFVVHLKLSHHC